MRNIAYKIITFSSMRFTNSMMTFLVQTAPQVAMLMFQPISYLARNDWLTINAWLLYKRKARLSNILLELESLNEHILFSQLLLYFINMVSMLGPSFITEDNICIPQYANVEENLRQISTYHPRKNDYMLCSYPKSGM